MKGVIQMVVSNPVDRTKILNAIKEWSNSATRTEAEKDLQKSIITDLSDEVDIDKKYLSKLAVMFHKQTYAQFQTEVEEIEELYESVTGQSQSTQVP
jgi:hypothetical protein